MAKKTSPAEVTRTTVQPRGSPKRKPETIVVENVSSTTKLKRRILYTCNTVVSVGAAVGICVGWEPEYVHIAHALYPLGILYAVQMLTTRFIS